MTAQTHTPGPWHVDVQRDARSHWTLRRYDGSDSGDIDAQPIATFYTEPDAIMGAASMGTYCPATSFMASGVANGESTVEQAVMVTDSVTFARAMNTITLEATPPGHEPMSTSPAATSPERPNRLA